MMKSNFSFFDLFFFGKKRTNWTLFDLWPPDSMWPTRPCKSLKQGYALYFLQPTRLPNKTHTHSYTAGTMLHQKHDTDDFNGETRKDSWKKTKSKMWCWCLVQTLCFSFPLDWCLIIFMIYLPYLKIETFCCPGWPISWGLEKHLAIKAMFVSEKKIVTNIWLNTQKIFLCN